MNLPTWRAISGNFFGPKTTRARKNRKIVSEKLMRFIVLGGNRGRKDWGHLQTRRKPYPAQKKPIRELGKNPCSP